MKKLMLGLGVAAIAVTMSVPSFAREEKRVVGYVETTTTYNDRDAEFRKADTSGDGALNLNEFMAASMFENEYEMFNMNDTNNDDLLTIEEFRNFSKFGPARISAGPAMTTYNFNQKPSDK